MTDEEIDQLRKLKNDRDNLKRPYNDSRNMDREYGEELRPKKQYSWLERMINPTVKSAYNKAKETLHVEGHMEKFNLNVNDFSNEVVKERVRQIQSKLCKVIEEETGKLFDEIDDALTSYNGQPTVKYFKERLKIDSNKA